MIRTNSMHTFSPKNTCIVGVLTVRNLTTTAYQICFLPYFVFFETAFLVRALYKRKFLFCFVI